MDYNDILKQYPYLVGKPVDFLYTPNPNADVYLETYGRTETGPPNAPRPKELPMGRYGIQVFKPTTRPIDILGDYVSHAGVTDDPVLAKLYADFKSVTPDAVMKERYKEHQSFGEKRPYSKWLEMTGYPELFRGYTFDQFGPNSASMYSPEQLRVLNQVKQYVGIAPAPSAIPEPAFIYKDPFGAPD
jgi:hypothetical protein